MKNVLLFLIFVAIGIVAVTLYTAIQPKSKSTLTPVAQKQEQPFSIVFPPSNSLKGMITAMSGDVQFQSRVATAPAKLSQPQPVQQAEEYFTGDNGTVSILFANTLSVKMDPKTHLNFVQTLPVNIVINQYKGTVVYAKLGIVPVSVRTQRLLITVNGTIIVSFNEDQSQSFIEVQKGSATIAYNDINFNSVLQKVEENQTFKFDYPTKTGIIE